MSNDNIERIWGVCDDLGYDITPDQAAYMWCEYCDRKGIEDKDDLPIDPVELFELVEEAYALLEDEVCTG